jgi:ubiquinone/menaquinone biosynthesis C-methylase UbiE
MAVTYMRKLEEEPETYDSKFTVLTKGINIKVQEWILNRIGSNKSILDVGCGTGTLALKMALKENNVLAIDQNYKMIEHAMQNYPSNSNVNLLYQIGSLTNWQIEDHSKDLIVSTFMLSELRPFEQQIFLRNAWKSLKTNGKLIIAAEFVPSGIWKLNFKIKRWWYRKKLRRLQIKGTFISKWFFKYLEPIGFKIVAQQDWNHGAIQAIEMQKLKKINDNEPGYYQPPQKSFNGIRAKLQILRCLLTGQIDHIPIEPGIYRSGQPTEKSPIILTANYIYTYIRVMKDLKGINAWVLCVDSRGINVWCAARGGDFGNKQVIEAIEATDILKSTVKKILILPQLSAGGVSVPLIHKDSSNFPFKIRYGPVWSKYLPQYLKENLVRKPDNMKLAKFTLSHRLRAGITHTTFLLRKIFIFALIALIIFLLVMGRSDKLWIVLELVLAVIITNGLLTLLFPVVNFTRKFVIKGLVIGIINSMFLGFLLFVIHRSFIFVLLNICFIYWLGFFSTMSFSGYSMASSPREIEKEYSVFRILNIILLIFGMILSTIGFLLI